MAGAPFIPLVVSAEGPKRRIAIVAVGSLSQPPLIGLVEGLRERGLVEGRDFELAYPRAEFADLAQMSTWAVERKADVIVAFGTTATGTALAATRVIPIVTVMGSDPVALGFVKNLARPEGNLTGLAMETQMLAGKRVELIHEIVPGLRRLAVAWNSAGAAQRDNLRLVQDAAARLGIGVQAFEIRNAADVDAASAVLAKEKAGAFLEVPSSLFIAIRGRLVKLAAAHRLPSVFGGMEAVRAGGLVSYSPDLRAQFRRAALFVERILKGAKPSELPIEQPTKLQLAVNLGTARALGVTIPRSVMVRADEVIE
jgi:putative ABC transport system substrate-binding protein